MSWNYFFSVQMRFLIVLLAVSELTGALDCLESTIVSKATCYVTKVMG